MNKEYARAETPPLRRRQRPSWFGSILCVLAQTIPYPDENGASFLALSLAEFDD
jgi:hypothetical protein